jgi:hypothetical protein
MPGNQSYLGQTAILGITGSVRCEMGALYGALQRGCWRGECGCGLLRGGTADGAQVQAAARDVGVGDGLGGVKVALFVLFPWCLLPLWRGMVLVTRGTHNFRRRTPIDTP